jgi:hypothetical protein
MINLSNIALIKLMTIIRLAYWYLIALICALTRTLFIIQTWSISLNLILILNFSFTLINFFLYKNHEYYQKFKRILIIFLPLLTISTLIVYISYMFHVYYRIMNLVTINIMISDRNISLLSHTLNYYRCCRIQEEILFDSVNERNYFLFFPYCQKTIVENEIRQDLWDNITTCGLLFRSIIFYIRLVFIFDLILNIILMIQCVIYIWKEINGENNQCPMTRTNYKLK